VESWKPGYIVTVKIKIKQKNSWKKVCVLRAENGIYISERRNAYHA
jgi:hypothetical protein